MRFKRGSRRYRKNQGRTNKPYSLAGFALRSGGIVISGVLAASAPVTPVRAELLGQKLFPADIAWNQDISNAPLAANSAAIIAHIGGSIHVHADWYADDPANGSDPLYGIPFNVVHGNSTAKVNVIIETTRARVTSLGCRFRQTP